MKSKIVLAILIVAFSCKDKVDVVEYENGLQLLTVNDLTRSGRKIQRPEIIRTSHDPVFVGEKLLVKISLRTTDMKIVDAFVDCKATPNPTVDTVTNKVSGCSKGLIVENDTILIVFRPTIPGVKQFPEITILTKDNERVFRTFKYSFDYKVLPNDQE
ncbi:MAG: hypothetical protein ACOYXT_05430 [Bacteroidota bacterium]